MIRKQSEPYISKYLHMLGQRKGLPIAGNFELTARCNFDCPMCYVHLKQEDMDAIGKELTAQQWIDLAQNARDHGMVFALLTGGEPFVRKDFFEIYGAMKQMGLMISINTNGSMLSDNIKQKLCEDPPARINVSLYGGGNDTYKNMCGQPAFDRVVNNIRELKEAGLNIGINLSVTPYNRYDLQKIYKIAEDMQVNIRAASYMYPSIRVNGEQYGCGNRLSPEEAAESAVEWDLIRFTEEEFKIRAEKMHELIAVEEPECPMEAESGIRCRAGNTSFWVTWDGRMLPCGMMPGPSVYPLKVGFTEAWNQLRQETAKICTPKECAGCPKRDICVACAAVYVTETGKFDSVPNYACRMTDAVIQKTWQTYLERNDSHNVD